MKAYLIYPHQLYDIKIIERVLGDDLDFIFLVEEFLYFKYFNFHPLKIKFHRDSMHAYALELEDYFKSEEFISVQKQKSIKIPKIIFLKSEELHSVEMAIDILKNIYNVEEIVTHDPTDDWLKTKTEKHIQRLRKQGKDITIKYLKSPNFIFEEEEIRNYFTEDKNGKIKFFMNNFYIYARKKLHILIEDDGAPVGGAWNYDAENRKKIPKNEKTPDEENFSWEYTRTGAQKVLEIFLKEKFSHFGDYEDALVHNKNFLYHSTLSPYLNVGLLDPKEVVFASLSYYEKNKDTIKLATVEGFVRQIIGWREYMRAVYILRGREIRNSNYFNFKKELPYSFWTGETGNSIVDTTIRRTIKYAYNHHIERLMILGNYILLHEYNPDDAYKWFMEMYIDAYDWVMVPNVYSMSQYADGGLIVTKPYISASAYILKMSNYDKKEIKEGGSFGSSWASEWDTLYWDFIYTHREKFKNNYRMSMMVALSLKKINEQKKD